MDGPESGDKRLKAYEEWSKLCKWHLNNISFSVLERDAIGKVDREFLEKFWHIKPTMTIIEDEVEKDPGTAVIFIRKFKCNLSSNCPQNVYFGIRHGMYYAFWGHCLDIDEINAWNTLSDKKQAYFYKIFYNLTLLRVLLFHIDLAREFKLEIGTHVIASDALGFSTGSIYKKILRIGSFGTYICLKLYSLFNWVDVPI